MGLYGNIDTMSIPELFGWVDGGKKSGTLEVERDKIIKRIMFREGRVVGCSSNEPATLMGQFLLSRGKITREILSEAMRRHEQSENTLGEILAKMGAISRADQDEFVASKIEETIFGLFDWDDAVFRFYTDALPDPNALPVELEIREILERGLKRSDERERSREAIADPGIVLRRTGRPEPSELEGLLAARRVFELIDGKKTVAEILLHSHAPEFLVTKFLTVLLRSQVVEILDVPAEPADPVAEPLALAAEPAPDLLQLEIESLMTAAEQVDEEILVEEPQAPALELSEDTEEATMPQVAAEADGRSSSRELQEEINVALQLMSGGQPEAALELLNAMAAVHPGDVSLGKLVSNAEQDYRQQKLSSELCASKIPTRTQVAESSPNEKMTAEESFLLEHIDGITDIQALLWVTPMRDVEVLKTLSNLLRKGWIETRQAA